MRLSETQKTILKKVDTQTKVTAGDLGLKISLPAGPCARSLNSLVDLGLMKAVEKNGMNYYSRTAAGTKALKQ